MIPYFEVPPLSLGPLELHAFGALAALGIYVGARLAAKAARTIGPGDDLPIVEAAPWMVVGGVIGGHLVHVLGYHPEILATEGWTSLLKVWDGLSSMGGVLGGLITIVLFFRWKRWRLIPSLNALALGIAPGWGIARLGCFAAHDHKGTLTDFPLAVAFPGGARHDLGLYEAVLLFAIAGVLWLLARKPRPEGFLMGVLAIAYAVPRFFMDFLRATDLPFSDGRIAGLTPAQYTAFLLVGIGTWLLVRSRNLPAMTVERRAEQGSAAAA